MSADSGYITAPGGCSTAHLAEVARREGFAALSEVAVEVDEPILKEALHMALSDREHPEEVRTRAELAIDENLRQLESSMRAATAGILAIVAGKQPQEVARSVEAVAAAFGDH